MKYFIDTEFLEGAQKESFPISLFRKNTPNTIDLISIGIVTEDGREYYAISKDFNLKEAWNRYDEKVEIMSGDIRNRFPNGRKYKEYWIRENVLKSIWRDLFFQADDCSGLSNKQTEAYYKEVNSGNYDKYFTFKSLKGLISHYGKTNKDIAEEVINFTTRYKPNEFANHPIQNSIRPDNPEFYAYYSDYDWVVFAWLFGKMIDLPKGLPMYCKDLKQMLDEKAKKHIKPFCFGDTEKQVENMAERSVKGQVESFKTFSGYPKQDPSKSHNAIEDARWNKRLFEFLQKL